MYHGAPDTFGVEEHQVAGQCCGIFFLIIAIQFFQYRDKCSAKCHGLQTCKGIGHFTEHIPTEYKVVYIFFCKKLFAFFVSFRSSGGAFVHSIFFAGSFEDQVVQESNEQTHQSQRNAGHAGISSQEETTEEEGQELRTADNVDGHREAQSRQDLTGDAQRIGDPDRQAVHEVADGFGAEVQTQEHRDTEQNQLESLRPNSSHEHDALVVANLCIFVRLLYRVNHHDTTNGMQLSTQQAQRYGNGNGLRNVHAAEHCDGDAAQRSSSFVPHNGTAGCREG